MPDFSLSLVSGPQEGEDTLEGVVEILNNKGLHARAAAKFVKTVSEYDAQVWVMHGHRQVPGASLMGLLMLAAGKGSILTLKVQGSQRAEALNALKQLVGDLFYEGC